MCIDVLTSIDANGTFLVSMLVDMNKRRHPMKKRPDEHGRITYNEATGQICDHTCRMKAVEERRSAAANHARLTGTIGR